jgi:RND superfamily putative drug exporter
VTRVGPIGRLGRWTAGHGRIVALAWLALALPLALLAPRVEHALSGAGWEASGSESVEARALIEREFDGLSSSGLLVLLHSESLRAQDPAFRRTVAAVEELLTETDDVAAVVGPREGVSVSRDGHTAVVQAGAGKNPNDMVRAADDLKDPLSQIGAGGLDVSLTGAPGMWSDFNGPTRRR